VQRLGADTILDYRKQPFERELRDLDVVLDTVGGDVGERSIDTLRPGGALVTIVQHFDTAFAKKVESSGRRFLGIAVEPDYKSLESLASLAEAGKLRPFVSQEFPLEQVARAHELLGKSVTGKIVLNVSG
jgi:NADPH:quinone reductase-like Zn-dependent oxidoreductase